MVSEGEKTYITYFFKLLVKVLQKDRTNSVCVCVCVCVCVYECIIYFKELAYLVMGAGKSEVCKTGRQAGDPGKS